MGVLDKVLWNNDLFGKQKGETHYTPSLRPSPGQSYEITPSGRLELLECTYEHSSDPNAQGWGLKIPVRTGKRREIDFHGWLEFPGFGRAKFTDGTMMVFEDDSDQSTPAPIQVSIGTPSVLPSDLEAPIYIRGEALGTLRFDGRRTTAICLKCRHFTTNDQGDRDVFEGFWTHQVFEHHVPPDLIGVEGLEQISTAGIRLGVQIIVRSRPQS
jgi:hypothetical protein